MTFLEKLDLLMGDMSINKAELSRISGVPYTTIDGFYKKGYENAKISTIRKIAHALGTSLDYLVEESADSSGGSTQTVDTPPPDALTADIEQFARTLNPEQAAMLNSILTRVANAVRSTAEPPTPHDLTDEEMHAELSRQLAGERESREKGTASSGSGLGSCGTG